MSNESDILGEKTTVVTIDDSDLSLSEDDTTKVTNRPKTRNQMATSTPTSKTPVSARTRQSQTRRGKNLLEKTSKVSEIRIYECFICDLVTPEYEILKKHIESVHEEPDNELKLDFECELYDSEIVLAKIEMEEWLDWSTWNLNQSFRRLFDSPDSCTWASDLQESYRVICKYYKKFYNLAESRYPEFIVEDGIPNPKIFPAATPPPPPKNLKRKQTSGRVAEAKPSTSRSSSRSRNSNREAKGNGDRQRKPLTMYKRAEGAPKLSLGSNPTDGWDLRGRAGGHPSTVGMQSIHETSNYIPNEMPEPRASIDHVWWSEDGVMLYGNGGEPRQLTVGELDLQNGSALLQNIESYLKQALGPAATYTVSNGSNVYLYRSPPASWLRLREMITNAEVRGLEMSMMHMVPRGRPNIPRRPTIYSPPPPPPPPRAPRAPMAQVESPAMAQATPSIGSTTETATIVNFAEVELSSSEEIDLAPGAPSVPRNVPDVKRVLVPPPPAYVFHDMEAKAKAKILGNEYPSPNSSFEENWEITHPPRVPPYDAKDLRHLVNLAKKLEAWKEDCREKARKRRIAKVKADIIRIQGPDTEESNNNNEQKSEIAQDEVVEQVQEEPAQPEPAPEDDTDEIVNSSEEF